MTLTYEDDEQITQADRDWSRGTGIATTTSNPLRRIQPGDFSGDLPNFGSLGIGDLIPTDNAGLTLSADEQALVARAQGASSRTVLEDPRFWLTSQEGSIAPTFGGRSVTYVDINGNGIADCQESRAGQTGFLAGCWFVDGAGQVQVFQDGLIATGGLTGAGGNGGRLSTDRDTLFPETDRFVANFNTTYDVTDNFRLFYESKYVLSESSTFAEIDTFYDTLFIPSDNPFIPTALDPVVDVTGGLLLTQDPVGFSDDNPTVNERETIRLVGGFQWDYADNHSLEFSANWGQFKNTQETTGLYLDRVFAAIDAVEDTNGEIVCRSDLDPNAFYEIDYFTAGNGYANGGFASNRYYSFTPGDGQCQPFNPFGAYAASDAARNFITSQLENELTLTQTVIDIIATGLLDYEILDTFLDGPIGYAAGFEYRDEFSSNKLDPLTLGTLPVGTPFTAGDNVNDVDDFLFSFTSIDNTQQFNSGGEFDVMEVFGEVQFPIFRDRPFAKELTIDAAIRVADYSTIGSATTWKVGGSWAPFEDLSFRATVSEAVRAPNIQELFDPALPITVNQDRDPCDPNNVADGTQFREANCIAGLNAAITDGTTVTDGSGNLIWQNPLTARFSGVSGGNPNLQEETSESLTIGAVYQPSFIDGLSVTLDYWSIEISDAIDAVAADDILRGCYDSADFPNVPFCSQFTRRGDGGLNFLNSGQTNFAQLEASGYDVAANYRFDVGENRFGVALVGTYQETLDRFFNPLDLTEVNPEVGEIQIPEYSGNVTLSWNRGPLSTRAQVTYQDRQSVDEIEDIGLYDMPFFDETYILDVNASYELSDKLNVYGGINNVFDEEPFSTQTAWPVGPRGRYFFVGLTYTH
ncbi:TonB-dependent receptor [Parvularcula sp. ZS-1/3]|uniref:TonB-dependent receptor n=1 Tax=Parvularcula mediterranea TaxID=2732508 RepID=A0A7Y3RPH3_9PROT|nr:TonB-dependent receptor [Parvularcula mediterranea]